MYVCGFVVCLVCVVSGQDTVEPTASVDGAIRLVQGTVDNEGRVEVYYNEEWGSVCDDNWDLHDANVACRQLGFPSARETVPLAGYGQSSGPIHIDGIDCRGTETNIDRCEKNAIGDNDCGHDEDSGVICNTDASVISLTYMEGGRLYASLLNSTESGYICDDLWDIRDAAVACRFLGFPGVIKATHDNEIISILAEFPLLHGMQCEGNEEHLGQCSRSDYDTSSCSQIDVAGVVCLHSTDVIDIRLAGSNVEGRGRVEIGLNGEYGTVCDDYWTIEEADVICRQLGYEGALDAPVGAEYGQGSGDIFLDDVACTGDETSILECFHLGFRVNNCVHREDASVICDLGELTPPSIEDGSVHLVHGGRDNEGLVEVFYNNAWGSICDDNWDLHDANVICRQLGYPSAREALGQSHFGDGPGPIHIDNIHCRGDEETLQECSKGDIGVHDCAAHSEDAGVICNTVALEISLSFMNNTMLFATRLNHTTSEEEGGFICDDSWDLRDAVVACRSMGFPGVLNATRNNELITRMAVFPILHGMECEGNEDNLGQCSRSVYDDMPCLQINVAGAVCLQDSDVFEVRLAGGDVEGEGRVEIGYNGEWGTICDDKWDINDALVICRQLGYRDALEAPPLARFGPGSGEIFFDDVNCRGHEQNITDCFHQGFKVHNCAHHEDASVVCVVEPENHVRLVDGTASWEGRVEVLYMNQWGSICDDDWDIADGNVVCRMLGFTEGAFLIRSWAGYGQSTGPILMDNLQCEAHHKDIFDCPFRGFGIHNCGHDEDAGVMCNPGTEIVSTADIGHAIQVRLVDGSAPYEGRLEIADDVRWGTVCDDGWDFLDAAVICRQLGYPAAAAAHKRARFGEGTGPILLENVGCRGNETSLAECARDSWFVHDCTHQEDASVICLEELQLPVRLIGGLIPSEGRLEVQYNDTWGTVCDDYFTSAAADVVCRQLGYPDVMEIIILGAFRGSEDLPVWMDDVRCLGNEDFLTECMHRGFGDSNCYHSEDVGIKCRDPNEVAPSPVNIRLNGKTTDEGRVEVEHQGEWRAVCDNNWDVFDATVVCRQLGFPGAQVADENSFHGGETIGFWLDNVECTGAEINLASCNHTGWGVTSCSAEDEAGVLCEPPSTGSIRLMGGRTRHEGRVEIYFDGEWGTVCDDLWSMEDADVVCRQLGYGPAAGAFHVALFGEGEGPIHLDNVECTGTELKLAACPATNSERGVHNCRHSEDAAVSCMA